jgi:hypothetical protein
LIALEYVSQPPGRAVWRCRCDCGNTTRVGITTLKNGASQSCGCYRRDSLSARTKTHGCGDPAHPTREYRVWSGMKQRCLNHNATGWNNYGGRGITICDRWKDSFESFLADMGVSPSDLHSLDRIDNDGPYAPDNCRWALQRVQDNNKRTNRRLTHDGHTRTLTEWARALNVPIHQIENRVRAGWPVHRVLMQPVSRAHQHPRSRTK